MENKLVKLLTQFYALDQGENSNSAKNPKKPAVGSMPQALGKSIAGSVSRKPWTNAMTWIKSKSLRF